jgi:hypothetical protein
MLVARTILTCPFGDKEVWVRCHIENSAVYQGSGADRHKVNGTKVGYTYHTGPGNKERRLKKDDVDFETLWDGLGDTGGQERVYAMWAAYFGMPRRSEAYNGIVFEPAIRIEFPVNPRGVTRPATASGDITATLDQSLQQMGSPSASNTDRIPLLASPHNNIDAVQGIFGESAAMVVWMFGNQALTDEEQGFGGHEIRHGCCHKGLDGSKQAVAGVNRSFGQNLKAMDMRGWLFWLDRFLCEFGC